MLLKDIQFLAKWARENESVMEILQAKLDFPKPYLKAVLTSLEVCIIERISIDKIASSPHHIQNTINDIKDTKSKKFKY